ncbi:hypothetical protein XA68_14380 [Ophiocordyceps unilateralis]|uniref:tetrahydrofolate synthase n=1 Tax=Ophiocordyceps unilateralis TaxID=268505 RepID=A0A2A9PLK6_OPHUN|nr:hypothetical protein XA68_14380 [Ophiocordyceps unilateralis]
MSMATARLICRAPWHKLPSSRRGLLTAARSYDEALAKLAALPSNRSTTGLFSDSSTADELNGRALPEMNSWLLNAGYSPDDLSRIRTIHVAGTKGKGSVCAFATAMLLRSGMVKGRVGTYTSPHLATPRERIALDGEPLARQEFADAVFELDERLAASTSDRPFFFRFMTLLAWHVFLSRAVSDAVIECGIGGEYDATNVLPASALSATVITQLDMDHVAMLGGSLETIAWHKAGIMKSGVRCFARHHRDASVSAVLRARAAERGVPALLELDDGVLRKWHGVSGGQLSGGFQKANQALAAMAVREHLELSCAGEDTVEALSSLSPELVQGLREARLRGRCEVLERRGVTWLLDGAHTRQSLAAVAAWLATLIEGTQQQVILVFNQQEREPGPLLEALVTAVAHETGRQDVFRTALFTPNHGRECAPTDELDTSVQRKAAAAMEALLPDCETSALDNVDDAVMRVEHLARCRGGTKVLVTGSLHLVGTMLRALDPDMLS